MGNLLRGLALIAALILMAGFGLCGMLGLAISMEEVAKPGPASGDFDKVFALGLTGVAISVVIGLALVFAFRARRAPKPPPR